MTASMAEPPSEGLLARVGDFEVRRPLAEPGDETSRSEGTRTIPTPKEPENES